MSGNPYDFNVPKYFFSLFLVLIDNKKNDDFGSTIDIGM